MELREVVSSNIKAVGWEDNNLIVQYSSGVKYKYEGVDKKLYEEFLSAESKGRFMNEFIKKGNFKFERMSA